MYHLFNNTINCKNKSVYYIIIMIKKQKNKMKTNKNGIIYINI